MVETEKHPRKATQEAQKDRKSVMLSLVLLVLATARQADVTDRKGWAMVETDHEDPVPYGLRSEGDEHLDTDEDDEDEVDEDEEEEDEDEEDDDADLDEDADSSFEETDTHGNGVVVQITQSKWFQIGIASGNFQQDGGTSTSCPETGCTTESNTAEFAMFYNHRDNRHNGRLVEGNGIQGQNRVNWGNEPPNGRRTITVTPDCSAKTVTISYDGKSYTGSYPSSWSSIYVAMGAQGNVAATLPSGHTWLGGSSSYTLTRGWTGNRGTTDLCAGGNAEADEKAEAAEKAAAAEQQQKAAEAAEKAAEAAEKADAKEEKEDAAETAEKAAAAE